MPDPSRIVETLKAKAMLLIQREREVFALRLGRERVMAWLQAFHRLSLTARPEAGLSMCAEWTTVMVEERHFQTAAAFELDVSSGSLSLIHGLSHTALTARLTLDEAGRSVLRERRDGFFRDASDPEMATVARTLGLQTFLWFSFRIDGGTDGGKDILLVAGVAEGIGGAQGAILEEDLVYFTMLGRHLSVLLSNATLIGALESATSNLRELFDHMRQAIVAVDATGTVRGVSSRQARRFFERDDLEGCSLRELLYPAAPAYDLEATSLAEWLDMAVHTRVEDWDACEAYAPREAILPRANGVPLPLQLEFRPLIRNGTITQLMLLASDVSEARRLEQVVQTHEAERASRVAAMRRLIAGGTQVFLSFVESARAAMERAEALLGDNPLPIEAIDELFRIAHTVRGEARAFDLVELEASTKAIEEDLDRLRLATHGAPGSSTNDVAASLAAALGRARRALDDGCEVLAAASPAGAAVFDQVTVQRSALRELVEHAQHRSDTLGRLVARLMSVPFGVTAAGAVASAPAWCLAEGKLARVHVTPRELMVTPQLAHVLPGVLTHLVRNAIAHGVESPDEREAAGKPREGSIRIVATEHATGSPDHGEPHVSVTVEDDGRGLDAGRILGRAKVEQAADPADLVFLPGLTTRNNTDALAGRGVGLDAVRSELSRIGYDVSVVFVPGQWTRFTITAAGGR
ncbi:MAG: ATP-binding protein [Myxococcota bacterium]|nr:ATP-binding protein [Myxococcota bacterium]